MQGMENAYVENGVSASDAQNTVGRTVIQAVEEKYTANNKIGNATIDIDVIKTNNVISDNATISISTRDFVIEGTITLKDGVLTWGEIEENVPAVVDRVELSPTTLDIEQGGSATVEVNCYNASNNLIPTRKLKNISIYKKSENNNITISQDSANKNKATITVNESENVGTANAIITATVGGVEAVTEKMCTINVKKKMPLIGQYVEYNISYTDMYVADIDSNNAGEQGFDATNGWRILDPGIKSSLNGETIYTGTKIISTGIPVLLYINTMEVNPWDDNRMGWNTNVRTARGLQYAKIETSEEGKYRGFESIEFEHKNSNLSVNKGGYISINGITEGDLTGSIFKTDQAESIATLTKNDLDTALTSLNGNAGKGSTMGDLFYLKGLEKFNYTSARPEYWLATYQANSYKNIYYIKTDGNDDNQNNTTFGIRPVVSLASDVYIKKIGDIWKIFNVTNP